MAANVKVCIFFNIIYHLYSRIRYKVEMDIGNVGRSWDDE